MSTFKKGKTLREERMEALKSLKTKFFSFILMAVFSASTTVAMIVFIANQLPFNPHTSRMIVGTVMLSTSLTVSFLAIASSFWQKAKKLDSAM